MKVWRIMAKSSVQSADRLFSILEHLSMHPGGTSLTELSISVGLPKPTVSRLLAALIDNGYAAKTPDSRLYRITMKAFLVGSRAIEGTGILPAARPFLEKLAEASGETVHLVTRIDDDVVYLYKDEGGSGVMRTASRVGQRSPMYCTGVGKCILACLGDNEIKEYWQRQSIVSHTKNTITSFHGFIKEIKLIRSRGWALDDEEHEIGVRCIAAPVLDISGNAIASISLTAPAAKLTDERIAELAPTVIAAARDISKAY